MKWPHTRPEPSPGSAVHEGDRVTMLELFFDLVFVFAFTRVTGLMAHGTAPASFLEAFIILSLLWWSWTSYTWLANEARATRGLLRGAFIIAMVAMFLASLAIPEAFHDARGGLNSPATLVVCYALVRITHVGTYFIAARDDAALRRQLAITAGTAVAPTVALLAVGAAVGGTAQVWIWLAAVLYDFAIIFATAISGGGWAIRSAAHFTERHALIVILALGESIISIGAGLAEEHLDLAIATGAVLALLIAVCLWFAYFHSLHHRLEERLVARQGQARAKDAREVFTYLHFPIIAGVILTALGIEQAMAHLDATHLDPLGAWALAAGPALFLVATATAAWRSGRERPTLRAVTAVVLLALAPFLTQARPLFALGAVLLVLAAFVLVETRPGSVSRAGLASSGRG